MTQSSSTSKPFGSVLDNKETFQQFSRPVTPSSSNLNTFLTASYKHRNLRLAQILDRTDFKDHDTVNKAVRRLRFCSSNSLLEVTSANEASIKRSSKSCKSPHCALCQRARAAKISNRFQEALQDLSVRPLFEKKHFYFLTLTLKHDKKTRNEVYLKELNKNCIQLFRSKLFKNNFTSNNKSGKGGYIYSRECTFSESGYHIHSHVLICSDPLKCRVADLQKSLKQKWLSITKDSSILRLDLVRNLTASMNEQPQDDSAKTIHSTIAELIKYGTKIGSAKRLNKAIADKLVDWMIATKGQNLVNVTGVFRGLQLTGNKSKWDKPAGEMKTDPSSRYIVARTSQLIFNHSPVSEYTKLKMSNKLSNVYLKGINSESFDVTDCADAFSDYLRLGFTDEDIREHLSNWVAWSRQDRERGLMSFELKNRLEAKSQEHLAQMELEFYNGMRTAAGFTTELM